MSGCARKQDKPVRQINVVSSKCGAIPVVIVQGVAMVFVDAHLVRFVVAVFQREDERPVAALIVVPRCRKETKQQKQVQLIKFSV